MSLSEAEVENLFSSMKDGKINLSDNIAVGPTYGFTATEEGCEFNCFSSVASSLASDGTKWMDADQTDFREKLVEGEGYNAAPIESGGLETAQPFVSVLRYPVPGQNSKLDHVAIYAGKDKAGNNWVLTKDGYSAPFEFRSTTKFEGFNGTLDPSVIYNPK